jgi:hypothetical protein
MQLGGIGMLWRLDMLIELALDLSKLSVTDEFSDSAVFRKRFAQMLMLPSGSSKATGNFRNGPCFFFGGYAGSSTSIASDLVQSPTWLPADCTAYWAPLHCFLNASRVRLIGGLNAPNEARSAFPQSIAEFLRLLPICNVHLCFRADPASRVTRATCNTRRALWKSSNLEPERAQRRAKSPRSRVSLPGKHAGQEVLNGVLQVLSHGPLAKLEASVENLLFY